LRGECAPSLEGLVLPGAIAFGTQNSDFSDLVQDCLQLAVAFHPFLLNLAGAISEFSHRNANVFALLVLPGRLAKMAGLW
jgi:hypothetical protein